MKIQITNGAGRDLGTYEAPNGMNVEAADAYARAHKYNSHEEAEAKRFLRMDRLTFTPLAET